MKAASALLVAFLAGGATPPQPHQCSGPVLQVASLQKPESFRVVTPDGFVVVGTANHGWRIGVYASTDPNLHASLVDTRAKLPSYGPLIRVDAYICRDNPQGWLVPILTSGHALCLRFPGLKTRGEFARTRFTGGSLELRWVNQGGV